MAEKKAIISIKELEYSYSDGTNALRGVSFDVLEGESIALIGPNGAGKSTIVKSLIGVLWPESGTIHVDGQLVEKKSIWDIRSKLSLVFQNPDDQIFCTTVEEDLAFGPINLGCTEAEVKQRVECAVEKVGISEFLNKPAYHLSGGQKKKVAIATALAMNPKIIVLDEPTANLSPESEEEFIDIINGLDITKIIISHDIPVLAKTCQRVVLLKDGEILLKSNITEFLSNKSLMVEHGFDFSFKCTCCSTPGHKNKY